MIAEVRFEPSGRTVEAVVGTALDDAIGRAGLPLARACSGELLCGGCAVVVLRGGETLEPESEREARAKQRNRVSETMRLSCCVAIPGNLVVTTPYW